MPSRNDEGLENGQREQPIPHPGKNGSPVLLDLQLLQEEAQLQNFMQTIPIFKVFATISTFKYSIGQPKQLHGQDSAVAHTFATSTGLIKKLYFKRKYP